jgi:hypothetical protein
MGFLSDFKARQQEARRNRKALMAGMHQQTRDQVRADRLREIGDRTVWVQKYLSSGIFNDDASEMAALGFDVVGQASNRNSGGLTVTYRKRELT